MTEEIKYNKDEKWVPYKQLTETPQQTIARLEQERDELQKTIENQKLEYEELQCDNNQLTQWLDEARQNADYWCNKCNELEQENKELKEEKQAIKSYLGIESKTILERLEELDEWKHNDKLLLWNYRSALEEIKNVLKEVCKEECDYTKPKFCGDCDCRYGQILTKINEVLNDN